MQKSGLKTLKQHVKGSLLLLAVIISAGVIANAQQVTATAGSTHQTEDMSVSWTLGEVVIETFQHENMDMTQGMHQPTLTVVGVEQPMELTCSIEAYPNPTQDFVYLEIGRKDIGNMQYAIYDFIGNLISRGKIEAAQTPVNFTNLPPAVYFIKVADENQEVKIFKIVKSH